MWTCRVCGATVRTSDSSGNRCPNCGAPGEAPQSGFRQAVRSISAGIGGFAINELLQFLDIPLTEADYVVNRPVPRAGEPEFDTRDDLPWPHLEHFWFVSRGRIVPGLCWMQRIFLKRPPKGNIITRSEIVGIPSVHFPYFRLKEPLTPAQRNARALVRMELLRGLFPLIFMLLIFLAFAFMIFGVQRIGLNAIFIGSIACVVFMLMAKFSDIIFNYFVDSRLVRLAHADMRRQVLRYLEWARERRKEGAAIDQESTSILLLID